MSSLWLAIFGGFLPAFVWLFFWLFEDSLHPEPKLRITLTFLAGAAVVLLAVPLEQIVSSSLIGTRTIFLWATIEELLKLFAAAIFGLLSADYDEPMDALIYMITAALGFAAAENTLFLYGTIAQDGLLQSVIIGDVRFVGSTLLHTLSSASIGIALALTYYRPRAVQALWLAVGVILSIFLHVFFNIFILQAGGAFFVAFGSIWLGIIVVLAFAERIKRVTPNPAR